MVVSSCHIDHLTSLPYRSHFSTVVDLRVWPKTEAAVDLTSSYLQFVQKSNHRRRSHFSTVAVVHCSSRIALVYAAYQSKEGIYNGVQTLLDIYNLNIVIKDLLSSGQIWFFSGQNANLSAIQAGHKGNLTGGPAAKLKGKVYNCYTPEQNQVLEEFYCRNPHLDASDRKQLGEGLGLNDDMIKYWFQKRRSMDKRKSNKSLNEQLKEKNDHQRIANETSKITLLTATCDLGCMEHPEGGSSSNIERLKLENASMKDMGMHVCLVAIISRLSRDCSRKSINLPLFGEVLVLSVVVLPFCVVFSILWAANQHASFAWIGQDVLGICLMISVLQIARLPNIKVKKMYQQSFIPLSPICQSDFFSQEDVPPPFLLYKPLTFTSFLCDSFLNQSWQQVVINFLMPSPALLMKLCKLKVLIKMDM